MRTELVGVFARGEGRPQFIRGREVASRAPGGRVLDHLLEGMRSWVGPCVEVGAAAWDLL
eukprot:6362702-Pyramimonas_sp.AAC.1